jgi:hypothetical protein
MVEKNTNWFKGGKKMKTIIIGLALWVCSVAACFAQGVAMAGNYAYVAWAVPALAVVHISNPAVPTVAGNYAYVADYNYGLRVIDITNPSSPFEAGFYDTPGNAFGVAVAGNFAYVADDWYGGLRVIDITNPAMPMETGFFDTQGLAHGVVVAQNYAYLADWNGGLRVIDISNPASPTEVGFINEVDVILPVELLSFSATPYNTEVRLEWQTASETDNDYFEIERDGTVMGRVEADNLATGSSYSWTESNLINGREYTYSLISVSVAGAREIIGTASATPTMNAATISEYVLHQNYPNPFNPETTIAFDIVEAGEVTLTVYNSTGQTVATLVNGTMNSGRHSVTFDASILPSGLYFYRLNAGEFTAVKKMVLMK